MLARLSLLTEVAAQAAADRGLDPARTRPSAAHPERPVWPACQQGALEEGEASSSDERLLWGLSGQDDGMVEDSRRRGRTHRGAAVPASHMAAAAQHANVGGQADAFAAFATKYKDVLRFADADEAEAVYSMVALTQAKTPEWGAAQPPQQQRQKHGAPEALHARPAKRQAVRPATSACSEGGSSDSSAKSAPSPNADGAQQAQRLQAQHPQQHPQHPQQHPAGLAAPGGFYPPHLMLMPPVPGMGLPAPGGDAACGVAASMPMAPPGLFPPGLMGMPPFMPPWGVPPGVMMPLMFGPPGAMGMFGPLPPGSPQVMPVPGGPGVPPGMMPALPPGFMPGLPVGAPTAAAAPAGEPAAGIPVGGPVPAALPGASATALPARAAGGQRASPPAKIAMLASAGGAPGPAAGPSPKSSGAAPAAAASPDTSPATDAAALVSPAGSSAQQGATATAPAAAALPAPAAATGLPPPAGGDVLRDLEQLDVAAAKEWVAAHFCEDVWLLLLDVWRPDSPRVRDALWAWRLHSRVPRPGGMQPDLRAFLVSLFGLEKLLQLTAAARQGQGAAAQPVPSPAPLMVVAPAAMEGAGGGGCGAPASGNSSGVADTMLAVGGHVISSLRAAP